jgi:hypothetical protein
VTFADSVLHLVRAGARIDSWGDPDATDSPEARATVPTEALLHEMARSDAANVPSARSEETQLLANELVADITQTAQEYEPGLADLEAAVGLVSAGLATRVVLSGFPSWPGLLWRAYQLAETTDVLILPAVVRPGGKVDIVITRDIATNG